MWTLNIIEHEIAARVASARQAFQELKRAIFNNCYLALAARMQLYGSLIVTRLLYGCSVWTYVPLPLKKLEALIIDHHRSMATIGFWSDHRMTDDEFCRQLAVPRFRGPASTDLPSAHCQAWP